MQKPRKKKPKKNWTGICVNMQMTCQTHEQPKQKKNEINTKAKHFPLQSKPKIDYIKYDKFS